MTTRLWPVDERGRLEGVGVRSARPDDVPIIVAMAGAQLREIYPDLSLDTGRIEALALRLMEADAGCALVIEQDSTVVGMLGAVIAESAITGERQAHEICWFVSLDARGSSAAVRLLDTFEDWARAKGCVRVQMSAPVGVAEAFYARKGYLARELTYDKALR